MMNSASHSSHADVSTGPRSILVLSNRLPVTVQRLAGGVGTAAGRSGGPSAASGGAASGDPAARGSQDGLERRPSPGGLVTALDPALREFGGTWIGWPGIELRAGESLPDGEEPYETIPIRLSESEVRQFYHGFSNRTLWPLLHSLPQRTRFDPREYATYEKVNARFAREAAARAPDHAFTWIHDYHLMLAPAQLRAICRQTRIAFFLHIPFPPYDIFRLLPWGSEILLGLLACDLVGFHVAGYQHNFLDCVERLLGARVDRQAGLVGYGDRLVRVGAFPLGIDFTLFESMAMEAPRELTSRREKLVLGVDRLDYTKGIPDRMRAFERLLEIHPRYRGRVVLLQLAVPSRSQVAEYRQLKREIDELVGRINGRFATSAWSPIRYMYRNLPREALIRLYREADVALVTPLRDGMNLVAKEFVACQVDEPGVLILSRLAGAAETMPEAILVNPHHVDGVAAALDRALAMNEAERRSRMAALRHRERRRDVHRWVAQFVDAVHTAQPGSVPPEHDAFEAWLGTFTRERRIALFLDYDGTLAELCSHPAKAVLPKAMSRLLKTCAARPDTDVTIVSGRSLADIEAMVRIDSLTYAGNHGLEIEGPDLKPFRHLDLVHFQTKIVALAESLRLLVVEGAWIEEKGPTLTFHYREVPDEQRSGLGASVRSVIRRHGFQARNAHGAIEARPPIGWDKGHAVLHVLRSRYGPEWSERIRTIYVGDDETDEDAFRMLAGLGVTFRVGVVDTVTAATHRLPDVASVRTLLEWLEQRGRAGIREAPAADPHDEGWTRQASSHTVSGA